MADRRISSLAPTNTRTSDGKKVDTWRVSLPDGNANVQVNLHSSRDAVYFSARGDHPCMKGLSWEGSDLAALREEVMADVEKAARLYFAEDWTPAVAIETQLYKKDRGEEYEVQLSFELTDIHVDPKRPVGNRGETHILKGATPMVMIQRSHDQVFEHGKSLDPANMRLAQENGKMASRTVVDGEHREAAMALSRTLEAFSVGLMRRMAPDAVKYDGVPTPEDLALIMRAAIDDPEDAPTGVDPDF